MKTKEPYCELDLEIIKFEVGDVITGSPYATGEAELPIFTVEPSDNPPPTP